MAEDGDQLVFHTLRERYTTNDGLNHQLQLTLIVDTGAMKVLNDLGHFQSNHVSHSFDQYVLFDEQSLDGYEGVASNCYYKDTTLVKMGDVKIGCEALVYIASDQIDGLPRQGYLEKIVKAAERLEFNSGYVRELKKWFHGKIDGTK